MNKINIKFQNQTSERRTTCQYRLHAVLMVYFDCYRPRAIIIRINWENWWQTDRIVRRALRRHEFNIYVKINVYVNSCLANLRQRSSHVQQALSNTRTYVFTGHWFINRDVVNICAVSILNKTNVINNELQDLHRDFVLNQLKNWLDHWMLQKMLILYLE